MSTICFLVEHQSAFIGTVTSLLNAMSGPIIGQDEGGAGGPEAEAKLGADEGMACETTTLGHRSRTQK